jgi:hypothetical protein
MDGPCAEYQRLKRQYELAVRAWGDLELNDAPAEAKASLQRKQLFIEARDACAKRVFDHKASCLICQNKL